MKETKKNLPVLAMSLALLMGALSACNSEGGSAQVAAETASGTGNASGVPAGSSSSPSSDSGSPVATPRAYETGALVFNGSGVWSTEVANLDTILPAHGLSYKKVTSAQLNAMTLDEIASYGVIIFPGGTGDTEANSLTAATHERLRQAVQERGVSYLGFCAGSFIGVAPAPAAGQDVSYGLGIVDGEYLEYYYLENQGTDIAVLKHDFADGTSADILWYGGPMTPNVPGGVVAKYPDGTPAISEMWSGQGFVVLSGGHPTANQATLAALGVSSSDGTHQDIAWKLIDAAVQRKPLPAF